MSTAIIKFENDESCLVYCKHDSYPTGLGFDLIENHNLEYLLANSERYEKVSEIPLDIQYEYIIKNNGEVTCQESWYAKDKAYHGGGIRHGGRYDLIKLKEKVRLQKEYTYRRPEAWKNI